MDSDADEAYQLTLRLLVDVNTAGHDRAPLRAGLADLRSRVCPGTALASRDGLLVHAVASAQRHYEAGKDPAVAELLQSVAIRLHALSVHGPSSG
jgi:hypothetical protein